jgi:hypothetical protein
MWVLFREDSERTWLPPGFEFLSGLPEFKRKRRNLVVFQAWIDDSGTKGTGKVLMLGGLFGRAQTLAVVADRWERELRARLPLPIGYFKADEARDLDGEFQHWRRKARDEKVRRLAAVIDRHDTLMVFCAVDLSAHKQMERYVGRPLTDAKRHPYNQPYLIASMGVLLNVAYEMTQQPSGEKVEVIFDEQLTFKRDVQFHYEAMRGIAPDWLAKVLPSQPLFRDDRDFVLLQAADLLMGTARMTVEKASRWPVIEWKHLRASKFRKTYAAEELSAMTVHTMAKGYGVPEDRFKVTIVRPPSDGEA